MEKFDITNSKNNKGKPLLGVASIICIVLSLPAAILSANIFSPNEDLYGYGSLGTILLVLILFLTAGFIIGSIGLHRKEKPRFVSLIATFINGAALIWILLSKPF